MTTSPPSGLRPLALLAMTWLGQPEAAAGEPAPPPAQQTSSPKEQTPPPHKLPAQVREAVTRSLPKYVPPKPEPPPFTTPTTDDDVLVLPRMQVTPNESPLDPFGSLSHKTRAELARKYNPGLGLGPLSRLNQDIGVEILTEEREYAKRSTLKDEVDHLAKLDPAGFAAVNKLLRDATAQPNRDWATSVGQNRNPNALTIRPPPYPPKKRRRRSKGKVEMPRAVRTAPRHLPSGGGTISPAGFRPRCACLAGLIVPPPARPIPPRRDSGYRTHREQASWAKRWSRGALSRQRRPRVDRGQGRQRASLTNQRMPSSTLPIGWLSLQCS